MSPTDFLSRHSDAVRSGDLGAVADLYTDDARLVTLTDVSDGADGVRDRFQQFFEYHSGITSVEVLHQQVTDAEVFATYAVQSERGRFEILNAFVLGDGACRLHFSNETEAELDRDEIEG